MIRDDVSNASVVMSRLAKSMSEMSYTPYSGEGPVNAIIKEWATTANKMHEYSSQIAEVDSKLHSKAGYPHKADPYWVGHFEMLAGHLQSVVSMVGLFITLRSRFASFASAVD